MNAIPRMQARPAKSYTRIVGWLSGEAVVSFSVTGKKENFGASNTKCVLSRLRTLHSRQSTLGRRGGNE